MAEQTDTHPRIAAMQIALMREAPTWRKVELLGQMTQTVKVLALSGLRQRHLYASEPALHRALADILLGSDLARKVYGPLLELDRVD